MRRKLKLVFLYLSKGLGLFWLSRRFTKRGLRILCYHGLSLHDEHLFRSGTFMTFKTFRRRLKYISSKEFPVLGLADALHRLDNGTLPRAATAITFDDGFYSTYKLAAQTAREHGFPATIYVTTYYSMAEIPIFSLVVQYMFWKTRKNKIDLDGLGTDHRHCVSLDDAEQTYKVTWDIIRYGEATCNRQQRCSLAEELGRRLDVDYHFLCQTRSLSLMNRRELAELVSLGFDIQLHTHRHRLPEDHETARTEISQNIAALAELTKQGPSHLCYPSGVWSEKLWPCLASAGIRSATTCDVGLNYQDTPKLALKRFLDSEGVYQIEFEAEMCNYLEILRRFRYRKN